MSDLTAALTDLARLLDSLAFLAWVPVIAVVGVALRVGWLQLTTPQPTFSRWLLPVALPADLRRGPVAPYGPDTRRAAYPAAMRRATITSSLLLPSLLLTGLWLASVGPKPTLHNWGGAITIIGPAPPGPTELVQAPRRGGGAPTGPRWKDFRNALIVPTRDRSAPPDSLEILRPEDLAVADPSSSATGPWDGGWPGLLDGPAEGPGGRGTGPDGPDGEPAVVDLAIVDEMPVLVSLPAPRYPEMARQAGVEGRVTLGLLVSRTGRVEKTRVLISIPGLDDAARAAALGARFKPASWQHRTVPVWVTLPINFHLHEAP